MSSSAGVCRCLTAEILVNSEWHCRKDHWEPGYIQLVVKFRGRSLDVCFEYVEMKIKRRCEWSQAEKMSFGFGVTLRSSGSCLFQQCQKLHKVPAEQDSQLFCIHEHKKTTLCFSKKLTDKMSWPSVCGGVVCSLKGRCLSDAAVISWDTKGDFSWVKGTLQWFW